MGRPNAVVAEQQQTFARFVQTPYRAKPWQTGCRQQFVHGIATLFVCCAHDHAARFVERTYTRLAADTASPSSKMR
jgi:uncharacterized membrane protein YgdD (TMEM256/DUF423 family)